MQKRAAICAGGAPGGGKPVPPSARRRQGVPLAGDNQKKGGLLAALNV